MNKFTLKREGISQIELLTGQFKLFFSNPDSYEVTKIRLAGWAEDVDAGVENTTREFSFVFDDDQLCITFGENISQALKLLFDSKFIDENEYKAIIQNIAPQKRKTEHKSLLAWLKQKAWKKQDDAEQLSEMKKK